MVSTGTPTTFGIETSFGIGCPVYLVPQENGTVEV
jgi:hypothetical protein